MIVVIAPDSFKGSLSSVEVAEALATGWRKVRPRDRIRLRPLADGGEGTLAAIEAAGGWSPRSARVSDPLGRTISASWLRSKVGARAVVEMAQASGLSLVAASERDATAATSLGTGELLRAVLDAGIREVTLGIGGSATTDGGAGLLRALGAIVTDDGTTTAVDLSALDPRLSELELTVASDVTNPLLGPSGAAATYGPQKGASVEDVAALDARNGRLADALETALGRRLRDEPGAGAAGGVGFALLCLRERLGRLEFRPGVEVVMELTGFAEALDKADLVITGEGRIDAQTAFGKTAAGVAVAARDRGVRCIAVGGNVEAAGGIAIRKLKAQAIRVWGRPVPLDIAIAAGARPLVSCGARLARTLAIKPKRPVRPKRRSKRRIDPIKAWIGRLDRTRPGLVGDVLDGLAGLYGQPAWERRLDPTSELVLTILTQSTADVNAEQAFVALRKAYPGTGPVERHAPGLGWGGGGLPDGAAPDWPAVEAAPYEELVEVIRPGGLPFQKAKTIQAALRTIRERRGDHSLEFLAEQTALEARDWLTTIPGVGKKTASVLLLFSFGMPLMPVDRHVERVSRRVGLIPERATVEDAHDYFLAMLQPDQMHEAHVNLIHHGRVVCEAQRPKHELCPLRARCRFVDPKAP
ncbi:MAG: glycerate kinase [Chloroflexota bacterium]|nr:MAG: glycerate kinase [Chloroflexota bacterium]